MRTSARTDEALGTNGHAGADDRTAFDNGTRPNAGGGVDDRIVGHYGCRMHTGHCLGLGIEQMRDTRVGQIRVRHQQGISGIGFSIRRLEQYGARLGIGQVLAVLGICQEAQLSWAGLLKSGQPSDFSICGAT
jgi:hypothetical protein